MHYRLFMPSASLVASVPLLLLLHGCTQDADDFAAGTAMNEAAEKAGVAVVYPSQSARANVNRCWNWFDPAHQSRGAGEPARLSALTRQICADYPIDAHRLFVAGMSAGGAMAVILGEQYSELFSAVGVHSGLATGVATSLPEAMMAMKGASGTPLEGSLASMPLRRPQMLPRGVFPVQTGKSLSSERELIPMRPHIVFHGGSDRTVHTSNAAIIVDNCLQRSGDINDLSVNTQRHDSIRSHSTIVTTYTDASQRIVCEHWQIPSAGHRWSGGDPAGSHTDADGPDASSEMIRFFLRCQLAE
jgi:poly(hydroxyalkanoate) depolymerase family esterase